jgi:hypothetical protein
MADFGQDSIHFLQPMHFSECHLISGKNFWLSGFWHHTHFKGQPFKKTTVLIPGPSTVEDLWISKTRPSAFASFT